MRPAESSEIVLFDVRVAAWRCRNLIWPKPRFAQISVPDGGGRALCWRVAMALVANSAAVFNRGCLSRAFRDTSGETCHARGSAMSKRVADVLVETPQAAGVKNCYGSSASK